MLLQRAKLNLSLNLPSGVSFFLLARLAREGNTPLSRKGPKHTNGEGYDCRNRLEFL